MSATAIAASLPAPPRWRLLIAFAILPVFDALVGFAGFPTVWRLGDHGVQPTDHEHAARVFAFVAGASGLLVTLCGAMPVVFWLLKRGQVSLRHLLIAGVALGNAPFAVFVLAGLPFAIHHLVMGTMSEHLVPLPELLASALRAIVVGSAMGLVSAVAFWFVGIQGSAISRPSSSLPARP